MKISVHALVSLVIGVLLLASPFLVHFSTSLEDYDPWLDTDDDGRIDMRDIAALARAFVTTGDPTKNVNVMNWPVTHQQTVFWYQTSNGYSPWYNVSGFGHVHLTWYASGFVVDETVRMWIFSTMHNEDASENKMIVSGELTLGSGNYEGTMSFPVPSEMFAFYIQFEVGSHVEVCVNMYLTYA